ncbi:MAG TPA: hypothetical protein VFQ23_19300, partial [Anaerolineales bacterium]|nr:hypothetical protein [Anaerolineales bacterium]
MNKKISRRDALKVGALGVLGGLAACLPVARATETLIPTYAPFPTGTPVPSVATVPGITDVAPTAGPVLDTLIN